MLGHVPGIRERGKNFLSPSVACGLLVSSAALFTVAETRKLPTCPSTEEWIKKMWHIHIMEHLLSHKRTK